MPSVKKKVVIKHHTKPLVKKKRITTISITKTRPTSDELKTAAKKVMRRYSLAIKNLAHR